MSPDELHGLSDAARLDWLLHQSEAWSRMKQSLPKDISEDIRRRFHDMNTILTVLIFWSVNVVQEIENDREARARMESKQDWTLRTNVGLLIAILTLIISLWLGGMGGNG